MLSRLESDDGGGDRRARRLRAARGRRRDRRTRRRPVQLVRAPDATTVLAHGPERAAVGLARRARDAARGAAARDGPARAVLSVHRRASVRRTLRRRGDDSVHLVDWPDAEPERSTRDSKRRWPWPAGSPRSGAPLAPTPASRSASRSRAPGLPAGHSSRRRRASWRTNSTSITSSTRRTSPTCCPSSSCRTFGPSARDWARR